MNRRAFLGLSSAALAAYTLDPDRLLWVPGAKTILLPTPSEARYYVGACGAFGQLERGERITARRYNDLVGRTAVWMDERTRTTVMFPTVTIASPRKTFTASITLPPGQARVVSLGMHQ
jgi:hypothetical protein